MNFQDFEHNTDRTWKEDPGTRSLLNAGMGCAGEGGEICDLVKKEVFHGKEIPVIDYIHEVGDVLFYLARIAREKGFTLEQAAVENEKKLRARHPDGWNGPDY